MKRISQILVFMIVSILSVSSVFAVQSCGNGVLDGGEDCDDGNNDNNDGCSNQCEVNECPHSGSPDTECGCFGYDFGIAKFDCDSETASDGDGTGIDVNWNGCESVDWTSDFEVAGVLHKESTDWFNHIDGTSGTIDSEDHDISHITFCGNEGGQEPRCGDGAVNQATEECDDGNNQDGDGCNADCQIEENNHEIPEFTTIGAGLVLAGAGAYIYRRRSRK